MQRVPELTNNEPQNAHAREVTVLHRFDQSPKFSVILVPHRVWQLCSRAERRQAKRLPS